MRWLVYCVAFLVLVALSFLEWIAPDDFPSLGLDLGKFHVIFLHLPIGFFLSLIIIEVLDVFLLKRALDEVKDCFLKLSIDSTFVTAFLGLFLSMSGYYDDELIFKHKLFSSILIFLALLAFRIRRGSHKEQRVKLYRLILSALFVLLVLTGHFGGMITHGSDFISLKMFMNDGAENPKVEESDVFISKIEPIFQKYCVKCHGPKRQKGELRLDSRDFILAGGEGGPVVTPGEALQSRLIRLVTLPEEHDDVMPPQGKGRLSAEEVMILIDWIDRKMP